MNKWAIVFRKAAFLWLVMLCVSEAAAQDKPQEILFYQSDGAYQYQIELLQHALNLTEKKYGLATAKFVEEASTIQGELALMKGTIEVGFLPSSQSRESRLLAIKIPILQGMLGYRLLLTTRESNHKLTQVQSLDDFRNRLIGGVGIHWDDLKIYNHNGLVTRTSFEYSKLFELVASSQIDYFALGVNEIFEELERLSSSYPQLMINSDVAFFYPFPAYFFVGSHNQRLAERLEAGLLQAEADGSFKQLFDKHFKDNIQKLKMLGPKRVFNLENPNVELEKPLNFTGGY